MIQQTFTITFGDQAENHAGMQKIGNMVNEGFTLEELNFAKSVFEHNGATCELIHLNTLLPTNINAENAYLLVVRNGLNCMIKPYNSNDFYNEQNALPKDKKAFMYGKVVNKKARHNLCFGEEDQAPDYENGKGTVIAFDKLPLLKHVRSILPLILGNKAKDLVAEGNYYYDINKTYIGWHPDKERRVVVAIRLGATFPLYFQWYYQCNPIGNKIEIMLNHSDMYIMSAKAVGTDGGKRNIPTLRHAAGFNI